MKLANGDTIEIKDELDREILDILMVGGDCPKCKRFGKINRQSLTSGHARSLIWLVLRVAKEETTDGWVHVPSCAPREVLRAQCMSHLNFWGMTESLYEPWSDRKCSGFYKPTPYGEAFARKIISAPKWMYTYNAKIYGFSERRVNVVEALGTKFSYTELMQPLQQETRDESHSQQ